MLRSYPIEIENLFYNRPPLLAVPSMYRLCTPIYPQYTLGAGKLRDYRSLKKTPEFPFWGLSYSINCIDFYLKN